MISTDGRASYANFHYNETIEFMSQFSLNVGEDLTQRFISILDFTQDLTIYRIDGGGK